MNNKKYCAYFKNHAIIKNTNKVELRIKEFIMLDWLIDPDEDPEEELYEAAESRAEDEVGEFIESSYENYDFLEILVEYIFNLCGVQLPLDADKISMFIYENSYERQVIDELYNNHNDIYDNLIEYIADRLRERYDDYDPDEKYERWNY